MGECVYGFHPILFFSVEKMGTYITQSRSMLVVDSTKSIIDIFLSVHMHLE